VEHKTNAIQLNRSTEWHFFLSQRSNTEEGSSEIYWEIWCSHE